MNESVLKAYERVENPKVLRKSGFIPGVLYGEGYEKGVSVKFEESNLNKLIHSHGSNAKVWIEFNGSRHFGFVKEIQRNSLSGKITHSDIHVISQNDDIRISLPILFTGMSELSHKNLTLHIQTNKIDASGKAGLLPEHITMSVENLVLGDTIKLKDLKLNDSIKVHDPINEVYAVVEEMKEIIADVEEEEPSEEKQ